jgi:hypothetical protein
MGKKEKRNRKNNSFKSQDEFTKALSDVKKIKKATTFTSLNVESATQPAYAPPKPVQFVGKEPDDQNQTKPGFFQQEALNYRFEAMKFEISKDNIVHIGEVRDNFRKEFSDFKNSIIKWFIGIIIPIIITIVLFCFGFHFSSLSILKKNISSDLNKSFDIKVKNLEKSFNELCDHIGNMKNK